jgi:hypothetical protein
MLARHLARGFSGLGPCLLDGQGWVCSQGIGSRELSEGPNQYVDVRQILWGKGDQPL